MFGADSSPAPPEVVTRVVAKPQVAAKPLDPLDGARFGDYEDEEAFGVAESRACDHRLVYLNFLNLSLTSIQEVNSLSKEGSQRQWRFCVHCKR